MTSEATAEHGTPDPSALVAVSFLAPWAAVSAFLPDPWRMASFALVTLLALLLLTAAACAYRLAHQKGLDAATWAFSTVLTMGWALPVLMLHRPDSTGQTFVCSECGRNAPMLELFCYRCGAA